MKKNVLKSDSKLELLKLLSEAEASVNNNDVIDANDAFHEIRNNINSYK